MQMKDRDSRSIDRVRVQTKLVVGPADDHYEREADSIARQVMSRLDGGVQRAIDPAPAVGLEGGDVDHATSAMICGARGGGRPLDPMLRRSMEGAFGADFSSVRLHVGGRADRLNSDLGARAFTTGSDVFVRSQDYRPNTRGGRELLAHELTHVVQQGGAAQLDEE